MNGRLIPTLAALVVICLPRAPAPAAAPARAETVVVRSGKVALHGRLWRPAGSGPFPAILDNHGSGRTPEELARLGPYEQNAELLGPVFARHGYVFLYLFRRGVGLSADQGKSAVDLMNAEQAAHGLEARNALQLDLLEHRDMDDAEAALAFLRAVPGVNARDVALVGHSFGGSLTLLMAARDPTLRAAVVFSAAGYSWDRSPELRQRLLAAADRMAMPAFFIHAEIDYSLAPGRSLDAELTRRGKPHRLAIYPVAGETPEQGHDFIHRHVAVWEPDVFEFLRGLM